MAILLLLLAACAPQATPAPTPTTAPKAAPPVVAAPPALTAVDQVRRLTPAEAKAMLDQGQALLYDTRPAESFQTRHARGAQSLPLAQVETLVSTLPKDKALILY
jgi:hypothetical protein